MKFDQQQGGHVILTGASGGYGNFFAKRLAEKGYSLVCPVRNTDSLTQLATQLQLQYAVELIPVEVDLSVSGDLTKMYQLIESRNLTIQGLINNAGYMICEDFDQTPLRDHMALVNVQINSTVELCHYVLGKMRDKTGFILNVSSTAGLKASPVHSIYSASKAFIINFTEGLALRYRTQRILISCLCPGSSNTDFFAKAGVVLSARKRNRLDDPDLIVSSALQSLFDGDIVIIPTVKHKLQNIMIKLMPRKIIYTIQKMRSSRESL